MADDAPAALMEGAAPAAVERPSRRAWALLAILTTLNVLSWVDRQIIPAMAPILIDELGLTSAQIGLLYGYAFIVCFVIAGVALGRLADRVHRPRLIAAGLAIWSAATAVSGLANGFGHLAAARVFVGIGEAALTPAALAMLADAFPAGWRARAAGIFAAGLPLGSGLSIVFAGLVAPRYGWRACFFVLGAAGVIASLALVLLPDTERRTYASERAESGGVPWPALGLLLAAGTLITFSTAASVHTITWLVQERAFDFPEAAVMTGAIYALAGTAGNVLGGWCADRFEARWAGGRLASMVLLQLLLVPGALVFYASPAGSLLFYTGWVLASLRGTIWYGPLYAAVQDVAPPARRATAIAVLMLTINLLGAGPGPWLAGAIGDRWTLTSGLLATTAVGLLAVAPLAMAASRARRRAAANAASGTTL